MIEKSHENGIEVLCTEEEQWAKPQIVKNRIFSCGYNGILCKGNNCSPEIRGNYIESNRKAGIKITDNARAIIGGSVKEDIEKLTQV